MRFAFKVKLSTYRLLISRGLTVEKMRQKNFTRASLNIVGMGVQMQIGEYRASFVGRYLSVGCVTRTIKRFTRGTDDDYSVHAEGMKYKAAIQRSIKAVFALRRASRVEVKKT